MTSAKEKPSVSWLMEDSVSREKMISLRQAAIDVGVPFRIIPKHSIKDPSKMPGLGEVRVEILYGDRVNEFWNRYHELCPPPPSKSPIPYDGDYSVRTRPFEDPSV